MSKPPLSRLAPLAGLVLLLAGEFLLFDQLGARHHTGVYPRWNDQVQYLTESYLAYEHARSAGLLSALRLTLINPSAQGTLHDTFALLVFSVAGPSRSAALSLNMLAFLGWQVATFAWIRQATRSTAAAFTGILLLLALAGGWQPMPGGAFDFRLDWLAACAMGASLAACMATDRFSRTLPSALFGLAVGFTLLTRFLTGSYLLPIYLVLAVSCSLAPGRWLRLGNLLLSGLVATLVAGPVFWINRQIIHTYYIYGHFTGPERTFRPPGMDLLPGLGWMWRRIFEQQVGGPFVWMAAAALLAAMIAALFWPRRPDEPGFNRIPESPWLVPPLTFALVPVVILTLHPQKTPQVLGIVLPGLALLLLLPTIYALATGRARARRFISVGVAVASLGIFLVRMAKDPHPPGFRADVQRVAFAADLIVAESERAGLASPRVAVDRITDSLDAQVLRVLCYERHRHWYPLIMTLPTGIAPEDPALIWERFEHSDFVFLTREGGVHHFPFDRQLAGMRPEIWQWAESKLTPLADLPLSDSHMVLFQRIPAP